MSQDIFPSQIQSPGGTTQFLRADQTWGVPPGTAPTPAWGSITGTLSAQTDLQNALNLKAPLASPTFTGKVITAAPTIPSAGLSLPPGTAPTTLADGDVWTTSLGMFVRINGVTVGPLSAATTGMLPLTGGTLSGPGNLTVGGTLAVNGNATLGDAVTDAHTVNGTLTASNTITATASATQMCMEMKPGAADKANISFFARSAAPTSRTGYLGFTAGSNDLQVVNEISGGLTKLVASGAGSCGLFNGPNVILNATAAGVDVTGTLTATGSATLSGAAGSSAISLQRAGVSGLTLSAAPNNSEYINASGTNGVLNFQIAAVDKLILTATALAAIVPEFKIDAPAAQSMILTFSQAGVQKYSKYIWTGDGNVTHDLEDNTKAYSYRLGTSAGGRVQHFAIGPAGVVMPLGYRLTPYVSEKAFQVYFPSAVANQKVQIYWPNARHQGKIEVEVTSGFENVSASGYIKRTFAVYLQENGNLNMVDGYSEAFGYTAGAFTIGNPQWDATNLRWYIVVANLANVAQNIGIRVKTHNHPGGSPTWSNAAAANAQVSAVYTTDATVHAGLGQSIHNLGNVAVGGGLRTVGTSPVRIESGGGVAPAGAAGPGVEIFSGGGNGWITAYNRTTALDIPMYLSGSEVRFNSAGVVGTMVLGANQLNVNRGLYVNASAPVRFQGGEGTLTGWAGKGIEFIGGHSNGYSYMTAYDRTGSANVPLVFGALAYRFSTIPGTGSAANVHMDANKDLYVVTSSVKYKKDIKVLPKDDAKAIIMGLNPITYVSRYENDGPGRHYGLIAEEVVQVEPRLVSYAFGPEDYEPTKEGDVVPPLPREGAVATIPDGVQYERLIVPLIAYVQQLEARLMALEGKPAAGEEEMIRYTLNITGLVIDRDAVDGSRDLVSEVTWELVGVHDSGVSAMRYGTQPLGDRDRHGVVTAMTPGMVSDWLTENLGAGTIQMLKDSINQRIMQQVSTTRYSVKPPWRVSHIPQAGVPDVVETGPVLAEPALLFD